MCYKNTEYAPNIDFNRIPRQNTHLHMILKLQSPNYYYNSMNINVAIKTTISDNRNETAMIFKQICDAVITSYPTNIFSMGTLFTKVVKIIDQHDRLLHYPRHCSKVFQASNALQHQETMFLKRIPDADVTSYPIQFVSTGTLFTKVNKSLINMTDFYATVDFSAKFSRMELLKQRQISYQPNATSMIFKRICYADITNYTIKFFSTGTLFTNVIKIIDQHDRRLRNPRQCSKVFQESNALQQQQISHNVLQKHWKCTKYW